MVLSAVAATAAALVAHGLDYDQPPAIDRRIRRWARVTRTHGVDRILWPLFPLGLPGGYITIAYALAHRLHRAGRRGGPAIVTSAWLGWLVHRAVKLAYERERPRRRNSRRRSDSYPSGHTTGATALAITSAYVLGREGVISTRAAMTIGVGAPLLMGAYRIIADDHWATDVAGGWLLGGAIGLTCNAVLADSFGSAAHHITVSGMKRRARPRRARSESPTYAG